MRERLIYLLVIVALFLLWQRSCSRVKDEPVPGEVDIGITARDTVFVTRADTVEIVRRFERRGDTIIVHEGKVLKDSVGDILVNVAVVVNSLTEEFTWGIRYNPIFLNLSFEDNRDIRKGFKVTTIPKDLEVRLSLDKYKPVKMPRTRRAVLGLAYFKGGPGLMAGAQWKSGAIGAIRGETEWGAFIQTSVGLF